MEEPAAAEEPSSPADASGGLPESDRSETYLAAIHELSERLTAITNYLASGLRLAEIGEARTTMSPRHRDVLEKAMGQAYRADEVIDWLRKLLVTESEMDGDRSRVIRERAYLLWEQDGHPHGRDLEHWLRAEAEISGKTSVGVTDDGNPLEPPLTEPPATRPRRRGSGAP